MLHAYQLTEHIRMNRPIRITANSITNRMQYLHAAGKIVGNADKRQ